VQEEAAVAETVEYGVAAGHTMQAELDVAPMEVEYVPAGQSVDSVQTVPPPVVE
jgi:hypothetical protein